METENYTGTLGSSLVPIFKPSVLQLLELVVQPTIHESLHEFSFDIFQRDPQYYLEALFLKCHTEQQIAQRLSQAAVVTDILLFWH